MKYMLWTALAVAAMMFAATASAAPNGVGLLRCFDGSGDGYGGACTIADSVATLNNVNGGYSGVYTPASNLHGRTLDNVGQLSFSYTGAPGAGAPRISLPLDTDGDHKTDRYAYIASYYCNNGAQVTDAINDADCVIWTDTPYTGWKAFVAAYPDATISGMPFIVADEIGIWTISNVQMRKQP